ncbi:hypothetical protein BDQ12DRAFT_686011 [Crucibulum laeve]|uniref:Mg-dependent DNase n=1 Tax=Crucibulum laeve TaxID=68775 RepID=A0A5C3M6X4_9AGAR|nr:hypothetical protein BDQ12DRAFT_686011 [Crucibulum laeve]
MHAHFGSVMEASTPAGERFIDIGVNLTDPMFRGNYHGKQKHDDDFVAMLNRAKAAGVKSMIITGGSLEESRTALLLAAEHSLYATAGCHPTRVGEFDKFGDGPDAYLHALDELIHDHLKQPNTKLVAIGECGLDYDRTHFASLDIQRKYFRVQLSLAKKHHLPLFLHSRAAHVDFVTILREEGFGVDGGASVGGKGGVVHSFTGTSSEVAELMDMGFYIGINGCSLKTEENLEVVKSIRAERLLLETDAPWCSITSTHASKKYIDKMPAALHDQYFPPTRKPEKFTTGISVKGRNEPVTIGGIAWVVSCLLGISFEEISKLIWKNTVDTFNLETVGKL